MYYSAIQPSPIMLEANPGPITVLKSAVAWVAPIGTSNVIYDSCTFARGPTVSDQNFRSVGGYTAVNQNYGVYHCTFTISGPAYSWDVNSLDPDIWSRLFGSLESDYNTWKWDTRYTYRGDTLFWDQNKKAIPFAQWQALGKDVHSTFLDPATPTVPANRQSGATEGTHAHSPALVYAIDGRLMGSADIVHAQGPAFCAGVYLTGAPGNASRLIVIGAHVGGK